METSLKVSTYIENNDNTPFPDEKDQLIIRDWDYSSQRMGGIPQISCSFSYHKCLDDLWSGNEYVEFNGEKYYFRDVPSSSKNNTDSRYNYEGVCHSERSILNSVFFTDVVTQEDDTQIRGALSFQFNGNVTEFAKRLSESMKINGVDYSVVVDEGIETEYKNISFEHKYFLEAINEIYNTYKLHYYFDGKICHVGDSNNTVDHVFEYGSKEGLLSVNHENQNALVITRIWGNGSSDNIPYYYPNPTEKGTLTLIADENNKGANTEDCFVINQKLFSEKINLSDFIIYNINPSPDLNTEVKVNDDSLHFSLSNEDNSYHLEDLPTDELQAEYSGIKTIKINGTFSVKQANQQVVINENISINLGVTRNWDISGIPPTSPYFTYITSYFTITDIKGETIYISLTHDGEIESSLQNTIAKIYIDNNNIYFTAEEPGVYTFTNIISVGFSALGLNTPYWGCRIFDLFIRYKETTLTGNYVFINNDNKKKYVINDNGVINELGLQIKNIEDGDKFYQKVVKYIIPSDKLMPSIYRESEGQKAFYEAYNNTYKVDGKENEYYLFSKEFKEDKPQDGYQEFEEIKPSIEGMTNATGQPMTRFLDFAYDTNDSDEIDSETNKYLHPYFFAKLPKTNGSNGFNLFNQANEKETMKISFTSGALAGCTFEIGVGDNMGKNTVQVNTDGSLQRDEIGNVLCGREDVQSEVEPQDKQNDTLNNEVWIALKKDDSSYSYVMPNAQRNYKPTTNDTFVILGITMPNAYIIAAEKKLDEKLISYMSDNNFEKFSFSISFSRIFLAEHPDIMEQIDENSILKIRYNGNEYELFISSYTYTRKANDVLPEIKVNLTDNLVVSSSSLSTAVQTVVQNSITSLVNSAVQGEAENQLQTMLQNFLRKDINDVANGTITFLRNVIFGQGGNYSIDSDGIASLFNVLLSGKIDVGNFVQGTSGARISSDGIARFISLFLSNGVRSTDFNAGVLGTGFCLQKDENKDSYLEVDRMLVRKIATFVQLMIQEIKHGGGQIILTPAAMKCSKVEVIMENVLKDSNGEILYDSNGEMLTDNIDTDVVSAYRCYFDKSDGKRTIYNEFVVGDQVRCQTFNVETGNIYYTDNTYYWRLVTGVGEDYIDLSVDDCDEGSGIPVPGDEIVQLGNRDNKARQNAIVLGAFGEGSPYFVQYSGIDRFELTEDMVVTRLSPSGNRITGELIIESTGESVKTSMGSLRDDISGFRSETSTQFLLQEGKIASKVSETTFNENNKAVSERFSSIEQTVGGITSTVQGVEGEVSEISQRVDGISLKVGTLWSENLFPDGDFRHGTLAKVEAANIEYVKGADIADYPFSTTAKALYLVTQAGISMVVLGRGQIPAEPGRTYTAMFRCYCNQGDFTTSRCVGISFLNADGGAVYNYNPENVTLGSWRQVVMKAAAPKGTRGIAVRVGTDGQGGKQLYVTDFMVFEGDLEANPPEHFVPGSEDGLLATGIDIREKSIRLTSDNVSIRNNSGEETARLDEDGTFTANAIQASFKRVNLDSGVRGIIFKNAFSCVISPTHVGPYVFLPNDAGLSGRVLRIAYGWPGGSGQPIYLLHSVKECKFYMSGRSYATAATENFAIRMIVGCVVSMIAVPSGESGDSPVNWHVLTEADASSPGFSINTDVDEELWQEYWDTMTDDKYITI